MRNLKFNTKTNFIIITLIIITCYILTLFIFFSSSKENSLKVGQIWIYKINVENPFKPMKIFHQRIIDIKGDYVLYVENFKDTLSERKSLFILNAEEKK